jgi:hypothetical protein
LNCRKFGRSGGRQRNRCAAFRVFTKCCFLWCAGLIKGLPKASAKILRSLGIGPAEPSVASRPDLFLRPTDLLQVIHLSAEALQTFVGKYAPEISFRGPCRRSYSDHRGARPPIGRPWSGDREAKLLALFLDRVHGCRCAFLPHDFHAGRKRTNHRLGFQGPLGEQGYQGAMTSDGSRNRRASKPIHRRKLVFELASPSRQKIASGIASTLAPTRGFEPFMTYCLKYIKTKDLPGRLWFTIALDLALSRAFNSSAALGHPMPWKRST